MKRRTAINSIPKHTGSPVFLENYLLNGAELIHSMRRTEKLHDFDRLLPTEKVKRQWKLAGTKNMQQL